MGLDPQEGDSNWAALYLTVLGPAPALRIGTGVAEPLLGAGKPLALLTYLACSPRRTAAREHLVDLLWSDLEPERGRHALRQTLWYLRQQLGSASLSTRGDALELVAPVRLDRDAFLAAVEAGDLPEAARGYTGQFLDGFAAPGSVEFEHWADVERQRLRSTFLRVAEALVRRWLDEGSLREAALLARRARDADPASESAWRLLFEALVLCNDRLALTLEVDQFLERLGAAGRAPEPATRALLGRLNLAGHGAPVAEDAAGLVAELVGREQPFGEIVSAWQAAAPHAQHLHLSAAAGLGKTRLLRDAAVRLRTLGARVVQVRAHPGQRDIGYSFAALLAEQLAAAPGAAGVSPATAGALIALSPSLSSRYSQPADGATGDEALRRRAAALAELVRVLAEEHRLALLLDDLHWLDPASRQVLLSVLEQVDVPGLVVVTAARPVPGGDVGQERTIRLPLPPLAPDQVRTLTGSIGLLPAEPWSETLAAALTRSTGGVPLLVLETLQLAMDRGWLRLDDGAWRCERPEPLAQGLEAGSALRHRLTQLPLECQRVLTLLAVAGAPLGETLLACAAGAGEHEIAASIGILEQRGFALRVGTAWLPAHDEIAEGILALTDEGQRRRAHEAVGMALAADAAAGRAVLAQAGHHLRRAARPARLGALYARFLAASRRLGDGRRVRAIAREFLGEGSTEEDAARLVRHLPLLSRVRFSSARNTALGSIAMLALIALTVTALRAPPPANTLVLFLADSLDHLLAVEVPMRPSGWDALVPAPVEVDLRRRARVPQALLQQRSNYVADFLKNPAGDLWSWNQVIRDTTDSGTNDIFVAHPRGPARRLTTEPRDDNPHAWSPDGAQLLATTSRWSPEGWDDYDVAIVDTATGRLRRLTFSPDPDYGPIWSPDGQQIAFLRSYRDDRASDAICFIPPDSVPSPTCATPPYGVLLAFYGWWSADAVVMAIDSAGQKNIRIFWPATGRLEPLAIGNLLRFQPSPDQEWIAWLATAPGDALPRWWIAPRDQLSKARPLRLPDPNLRVRQLEWSGQRPGRYLDRLEFSATRERIAQGLTYTLTIFGRDQAGSFLSIVGRLQWSSSDTTVATVDSLGVVRARAPGTTRIEAAIPGWRRVEDTITVAGIAPVTLLAESWDSSWRARWRPSGRPAPRIVVAPDGRPAFLNNGDGSYGSTATTRTEWSAQEGLGLEATVYTPITRRQFQSLYVEFLATRHGVNYELEDTIIGISPYNATDRSRRECAWEYPGGEGERALRQMAAVAGDPPAFMAVGPWIRSGQPYRLRLQILPDGRCGVAINGTPVWYSEPALLLDTPYRVSLGYSSKETRILVGPLEVWHGVRQDVPWDELDATRDHRRPLAERPQPR